jgi:hypothetical protein
MGSPNTLNSLRAGRCGDGAHVDRLEIRETLSIVGTGDQILVW